MNRTTPLHKTVYILLIFSFVLLSAEERKRARDLGIEIGIFPTGEYNSITDVTGVKVGHTTVIQGDSVRTGVTVILPHGGDLFKKKCRRPFMSLTVLANW